MASAALVWKGLKVLIYSWGMVSPLPSSALITMVACTRSEECGPAEMRWWILTAVARGRNCSTSTSSNTDSWTVSSDSLTAWSRVCSRVHWDPEGLDEGDQLLRVQVSERGVHHRRMLMRIRITLINDDTD